MYLEPSGGFASMPSRSRLQTSP